MRRSSLTLALLLSLSSLAEPVRLSADLLRYQPSRKLLQGRGNAELRTAEAGLWADELDYEEGAQLAQARGRVRLAIAQHGQYAAVAESIRVRLEQGEVVEVFVESGRLMRKSGVGADLLLVQRSGEELEALGTSSAILSGSHLKRVGEGQWEVDRLSFTPCDCAPGEASWRVESSRATVDLQGEHASLWFPTFYVKSVPVLWLPWAYLPLSSRRTGLLVPRPDFSALNGFTLDAPLFITLGESHDLTLTPGYYFGGPEERVGIRGPRLQTELRYLPSTRTSGRATLGLLYDQKRQRDPVHASPLDRPRGLRAEGSLQHAQELGGGWFDRVDASFVSDGYYIRDLTADVLAREADYLRSTASLYRRADELYAGVELGIRQALGGWGYGWFGSDRLADGTLVHGPNTLHRLPAILLALPERPLFGPLQGGFRVEYVRLSPLAGGTGDEGSAANEGRFELEEEGILTRLSTEELRQRLFCPTCTLLEEGQGDRQYQPGEREARHRVDLSPRLSASFSLGELAQLTPYAAFRQDLYLGEVTGRRHGRGYPLLGAALTTELSRTFGQGHGSLRHSVSPALEARYLPFVLGDLPAPYDEVDAAIPLGAGRRWLQAAAELRQRLLRKEGDLTRELLRLDLGQGLDLSEGRLGDAFGRLAGSLGPVSFQGAAHYELASRRLALLSTQASLDTGRGQVAAGYQNLLLQGSERSRRGLDALVGSAAIAADSARVDQLSFSAQTAFRFGLSLQYEALLGGQSGRLALAQHALLLSYGPACDCWKVNLALAQRPKGNSPALESWPDASVSLELAHFGTFGTH